MKRILVIEPSQMLRHAFAVALSPEYQVETRADFLTAHDMGFDLVQGYLFGKPQAIRKFVRSRPQLASSPN